MSDQEYGSQGSAGGPENSGKGPAGSKFRERLEEFEKTLRQAVSDADEAVRSGIRSALPPEATKHLSNSKKEFLLFVRSIVDNEIQRTERNQEKPENPEPPKQDS